MRELARRYQTLAAEITRLEATLTRLTGTTAPRLVASFGAGPNVAVRCSPAAGDNPGRLRNEPAFARFCGAARWRPPQAAPAGTGSIGAATARPTQRAVAHRLGPHALRAADQGYVARRTIQGLSKCEIIRCFVDCYTRELCGWSLELRCRDDEAIACVEAAVLARDIGPGQLALGTDNGSQFTSRDFRRHLSARGISHRRVGYRDPESQAFIVLVRAVQEALGWRSQWESLEQARREISGHVDGYQHRPYSGLAYRIPAKVAALWRSDPDMLQTPAT